MTANASTLRIVDLSAAERRLRQDHGTDFTEAKEAVIEGLLRLTEQRCTGEGAEGAIVYGGRPSSKLVSGFLLPRFDRTGLEDETSDIHIATMGVDLQIASGTSGQIAIRPQVSIYVRELPSWAEVFDRRHEMMPQVQLSRDTRMQIEQLARGYILERISELPPLPDDDDQLERAGDAIAGAAGSIDRADAAEDNPAETAEDRGTARAIRETAEQDSRAAASHRRRSQRRSAERDARIATISAIRREAFDRAFVELGVVTASTDPAIAARPLTSNDFDEAEASEIIEVGLEEAQEALQTNPSAPSEQDEEGAPPATGALGELAAQSGRLEDRFAAPQPIPQKWRRIELDLGEFVIDADDEGTRQAAAGEFEQRFLERTREAVSAWLATTEGQANAYRRNERILPSQFSSAASWTSYVEHLRARRAATLDDVLPDLTGVCLVIDLDRDYVDATRLNLRVAIQNDAAMPAGQDASAFEHAIFNVALEVQLPTALHRPLQLDRIEPSYRFRDWLEYPTMGLNCGVTQLSGSADAVRLRTTWAPKYVQPRIDATSVVGLPTSYAELSNANTDVTRLLALPDAYDAWIATQSELDVGQHLPADTAAEERRSHLRDVEAYRRESRFIRLGIDLLRDAQAAARERDALPHTDARRDALSKLAAPWEAWLRTNEAFSAYGQARFTDWRLFQLAFILAHIPTFASRTDAFADRFDEFRDEHSASLLYFSTGGGKSEAFFGLLIFGLFFDRIRGKNRGVSALVRYPLRLLTLQQARRLMRILVNAELVRKRRGLGTWPFELGFWVGSGNTPNRVAQGFGGVPSITVAAHANDTDLLNPSDADTDQAAKARRRSLRYKEALESYDKLRTCPCCASTTGMRKYPTQHGRIGIVCFNDACAWNQDNPAAPHRVPLPFILTDDTIYQRAPSVVLGTIDKLALIGQHDRTVNAIAGMFGCARYMDPESQHLFMPRGAKGIAKAEEDGWTRLSPAFAGGVRLFHDPYPSLIIQDEGHLLDESLGTFSGLFETTFEAMLTRLGDGLLTDCVARWQPEESSSSRPRLAKVIAATATISDPDRQLRVLYQREPLRFPCPGPTLYDSFYASPRRPLRAERVAYWDSLPPHLRAERAAPRMRVYVSMMTNGRSHTMTTSAVVSAFHLSITRLRNLLEEGRVADAIAILTAVQPPEGELSALRASALTEIGQGNRPADTLATLLDLARISLTYVTNKKGGDQIIETLDAQVERDQRADGIAELPFIRELISGGVTIAEIQDVMAAAEGAISPDHAFEPLGQSLRNIVATSAISHGVDVDKFNAMFFAGLPSDIAEYIQASSRVGRTHVGFSLLVPTPHSRRDRYVVETHDQFHRFLERMIPPPAVQRWADRAIRRIMPSVLQAYLGGVVEQELFAAAPDNDKKRARTFTTAASIKAWAERHPQGAYTAAVRAVTEFALQAVGLDGRGVNHIGSTTHTEHYQRFVEDRIHELLSLFTRRSDPSQLSNFWTSIKTETLRPPMTSLRDIDAGGVIRGATRDPFRGRNIHLETTRQVMRVIRGQRMAVRSELDTDPAPVDSEDR